MIVQIHASPLLFHIKRIGSGSYVSAEEWVHGGTPPGWPIRDWSLITGGGGVYKMGKSRVRNFLRSPPPSTQDRVQLVLPHL